MDLNNFVKKKEEKEEILISNEDVLIKRKSGKIFFKFFTKKGFEKYEKFLSFSTTKNITTDDEKKAENFFKESLKSGAEGVMFKSLNSKYISGQRIGNIVKLKKVNENLDVVILKAEFGTGKRAGFYSSFYVGVLDESKENFLTIGKVASGIKELGDEGISLSNLTKKLNKYKIKEEDNITFFEPKIIIEMTYQEIQFSRLYDSNFALRFPKMLRLREDKNIEEINTILDIKKLFNN